MKRLNVMAITALGIFAAASLYASPAENCLNGPPKNRLMDKLDADHNGQITLEEFRAPRQKRMLRRFEKMDTDNNGQVSLEELQAAHDKRSAQRFQQMDENGDGTLDVTELRFARRHLPGGDRPWLKQRDQGAGTSD